MNKIDQYLLNDDQVADFVINGYHIVQTSFPSKFHDEIYSKLNNLSSNPGDKINIAVSELDEIYDHPSLRGPLQSLLGEGYSVAEHRHCHKNHPGTRSQRWHQDNLNIPALMDGHTRSPDHIKSVLVMYYPQEVKSNMGPTALIPGSHLFRSAPDRNASQGNFRDQKIATLKEGSLLILHYDIWHAGTANTSNKIRYMVKYLFERKKESEKPTWNHNSSNKAHILDRLERDDAATVQRSLIHKRNFLRTKMWNNIAGKGSLEYKYHDKWAGSWPEPKM